MFNRAVAVEGLNVVSEGTEPIILAPPAAWAAAAAAINGVFSIIGVCGESKGRMPTNDDSSQHFLKEKHKTKTEREREKEKENQ